MRLKNHRLFAQLYIPVITISIFLLSYNIYRILHVPMTHDESPSEADLLMTYGDYIHLNKVTANFHIFNSILRKFFIETFRNTPFFLRLDNLMAQMIYLIFSYLTLS